MFSGLQQPPLTSGEGLKSCLLRLKLPHGCISTKSKLWNASSADNATRNNLGIFKSVGMANNFKRKCKCGCGEVFETRRRDKFYLDKSHQVSNNNLVQYDRYRKLLPIQTMERQSYNLYLSVLGKEESVTCSGDFLRGKGIKLGLFNHYEIIDGRKESALFDIIIIPDRLRKDMYTIQKRKS